jgi:pyruvate/2-oxoglutarate dehydrogenase complex dihydrolipoamide acyltransferase (E2) component
MERVAMSKRKPGFRRVPFTRARQLVVDAGRMGRRNHNIHALVEFDVNEARRRIDACRAETGESFSFSAFLIACIARAVDQDRMVHAYRSWRNTLTIHDEVSVLMTVEIDFADGKFPVVHMIRAANHRSARDIHTEIRNVQADPKPASQTAMMRYFPLIPAFVRDLLFRIVMRSPEWRSGLMGTVGFTSVGMFGHGGPAWGLGMPNHTLAVTAGSISKKPGVVDGEIAIRDVLHLTISFNHDVVDGAPAARFTQHFRDLVESAFGLDDVGRGATL